MGNFKLDSAFSKPKYTQGNSRYPVIKVYASAYEKLMECSKSTGESIMSIATQAIEYALSQLENGGDDES
jgi:hypothetical protein